MKIAVIGCGTAGPASAILLHRQGHDVVLFEKLAHPGPVGAGIMIQPTGMEVLRRMGLLPEILRRGDRVDRLRGLSASGRVVLDLAYADLVPGSFGLGLHRGALFEVLSEAIPCERRFGVEVVDVQDGVLVDAGGARHGPFDLVIAADGARSGLRARLGRPRRASQYPWGALWACVDDPGGFSGELFQVYDGARRFIGALPTGEGRLSLFWSVRGDRAEAVRGDLAAWKREAIGLCPRAEPAIARVEELLYAAYHDVVVEPVQGRLVFLGDSAHAMSPQLGQGANLALVDAWFLAEILGNGGSAADWAAARRGHLRYYQWATRFLTPFFQSDLPFLAGVRDLFMGPACRVPWMRHQFIATMAGVKTGILWGELDEGWPRAPRLEAAP